MDITTKVILIVNSITFFTLLFASFRIVRPYEKGLIERFGKYNRLASSGLNFIIPFGIEKMYRVNLTEMMVNAEPQEIITKDKLNAIVDAQVYFKIKNDEENIKASQYNVYNYKQQIVALAKSTLRNIIGTMTLNDANSDRNKINQDLMETLKKETKNWGIDIVRTELKEINPPKEVQDTMNKVVIAENEKQSAIDFAKAKEIEADGERMAKVKIAEGDKQSAILKAEGQKKSFELINESFIGNSQLLKQLEVAENILKNNSKIIVPQGSNLVNIVGETSGAKIIPVKIYNKKNKKEVD